MHVLLGAVGGLLFAFASSVLIRFLLRAHSRRQSYLYTVVGLWIDLACLALMLAESLAAGIIAAVLVFVVRACVRRWRRIRRPPPDYVVDDSILKDAISPRLLAEMSAELAELEERARVQGQESG